MIGSNDLTICCLHLSEAHKCSGHGHLVLTFSVLAIGGTAALVGVSQRESTYFNRLHSIGKDW